MTYIFTAVGGFIVGVVVTTVAFRAALKVQPIPEVKPS